MNAERFGNGAFATVSPMDDKRRTGTTQPEVPAAPARLFTVRIWTENGSDPAEHRGEVREVATGAHRGFSRWDDLTSFLTEQLATPPATPKEP